MLQEENAIKSRLKTQFVYLDTCTFWRHNFSWDSAIFVKFKEYTRASLLTLKTTSILMEEIEDNIHKKVVDGVEAVAKARRIASILHKLDNSPFSGSFNEINIPDSTKILMEKAKSYFECCGAEEIDVFGEDISKIVFKKYFSRKPPFGNDKKKNEFPDAFVATALERWCNQKEAKIYIISSDGDLKECCSTDGPLIYVSSIEELITIATVENKLRKSLETWLIDSYEVQRKIEDDFADHNFVLEDQVGVVDGVTVLDVVVQGVFVLDRKDDVFRVEIPIDVSYEADLSYADFQISSYYRGNDDPMLWGQIKESVVRMEQINVKVECSFDEHGRQRAINSIEIDSQATIRVCSLEKGKRR